MYVRKLPNVELLSILFYMLVSKKKQASSEAAQNYEFKA